MMHGVQQFWKHRQGFGEHVVLSCQVTMVGIVLVGLQHLLAVIVLSSSSTSATTTNSINWFSLLFRWISWGVLTFGVICSFTVERISRPPRNNASEFQRRWKAYNHNNNNKNHKQKQSPPSSPPILVCIGDSLTHGTVSANFVKLIRPKLFQSIGYLPSSSSLSNRLNHHHHHAAAGGRNDNPLSNPLWVVNLGQNTICSWTVYHERLASAIACHPDWVLIMIGSNDVRALWKPEYSKRYQDTWNLPVPPNWTDYRKHVDGMIRYLLLQESSSSSSSSSAAPIQVGLCTLPPMGEDLEHPINSQLIRKANEMLHDIAKQHGDRCTLIPVYETLVEELRQRQGRSYPHHRRPGPSTENSLTLAMCMAPLHHVLGCSWNFLSHLVGNHLLSDSLHLNDDAADIVANLVVQWLVKTNIQTRIQQVS